MFVYGNRQSLHHLSHSFYENPLERSFHRHFHDDCELLLIVSGDVDYNIDGRHYSLKPYDLLFIPYSTYHFLIPISNQPYENYVININPGRSSLTLIPRRTWWQRSLLISPTIWNRS